jgi:hypothetical protein
MFIYIYIHAHSCRFVCTNEGLVLKTEIVKVSNRQFYDKCVCMYMSMFKFEAYLRKSLCMICLMPSYTNEHTCIHVYTGISIDSQDGLLQNKISLIIYIYTSCVHIYTDTYTSVTL